MPKLSHIHPVLSQGATLEGLTHNPFRIFGLRVDSTNKEIDNAIKDLRIQMELGAELSHAFALGAIEPSVLMQSSQRLKDPVQRICDECFWFWPLDLGTQDVALDLIANGDKAGAKAAWLEFVDHPEWGPIAVHNLAIHTLLESFGDSTELDKYGQYTKDFLSSPVCVSRIKARLRTLDDPRLPRNAATDIIEELRRVMATVQIRIGLERLAQMDTVRGQRNLHCARKIAGDEHLLGELVESELEAELERLEAKNAMPIDTATEADWTHLFEQAQYTMGRMQPFPSLAARRELLGNRTATVLRRVSIYQYNERKNRKKALEIAKKAQSLATGDMLQKIKDDIRTVQAGIESEQDDQIFDVIHSRIEKMAEMPTGSMMAYEGQAILRAINTAVSKGGSKERADVLYHNLAWCLRGKAVKAFNENDDLSTARLLVATAQEVVADSERRGMRKDELKRKLLEDSAALDRNAAAQRQATRNNWSQNAPSRSGGGCLVPIVAILCLTGAAGYAAPVAMKTIQTWVNLFLS